MAAKPKPKPKPTKTNDTPTIRPAAASQPPQDPELVTLTKRVSMPRKTWAILDQIADEANERTGGMISTRNQVICHFLGERIAMWLSGNVIQPEVAPPAPIPSIVSGQIPPISPVTDEEDLFQAAAPQASESATIAELLQTWGVISVENAAQAQQADAVASAEGWTIEDLEMLASVCSDQAADRQPWQAIFIQHFSKKTPRQAMLAMLRNAQAHTPAAGA